MEEKTESIHPTQDDHQIQYNTEREQLRMPEYGRHVQNLIKFAKTIEDRDKRQAFVEKVAELMFMLNPPTRNEEDHLIKIWHHIFEIADYDLDVIPPDGEIPTREMMHRKPDPLPYPHKNIRLRHYGYNVERLIQKAIEMDDDEKRREFVKVIAAYMKQAYRAWSREQFVNDDIIKNDLNLLSGGLLTLDQGEAITNLVPADQQQQQQQQNGRSQKQRKRHKKQGGNGGGRNQRRRRKKN